jgi:hypothetical protein
VIRSRTSLPIEVGQRWRVYSVERREWCAATLTQISGRIATLAFDRPELHACTTPVEFLFDKPDMFRLLGPGRD